ncbi:unnamed protein product [Caenorhabditis sp. 36 PRJEB53466]|nr:unnamed protein product [Caenorhabditis sp. 36 PRJEB53466]
MFGHHGLKEEDACLADHALQSNFPMDRFTNNRPLFLNVLNSNEVVGTWNVCTEDLIQVLGLSRRFSANTKMVSLNGTRVTLAQFYRADHQLELRYPNAPLVTLQTGMDVIRLELVGYRINRLQELLDAQAENDYLSDASFVVNDDVELPDFDDNDLIQTMMMMLTVQIQNA